MSWCLELNQGVLPGGTSAGKENRRAEFELITLDRDRLYATIDEFVFRAPNERDRISASFVREEQPRLSSWGQLDPEFLGKAQFSSPLIVGHLRSQFSILLGCRCGQRFTNQHLMLAIP